MDALLKKSFHLNKFPSDHALFISFVSALTWPMGILLPWLPETFMCSRWCEKTAWFSFFFFFFWKPLCWVSLNYLEFPISCCSPCLEEFHSKEKFCSVSLCVRSAGSFTALFPQGVAIKNRIVKFVCLMFQDGEQKLSISQSAFTLTYTMAFFLSLEGIWTPFQNKNSTMEVCGLFRQQKQPTSLKKLRLSGFFILWSTNWMH